MHMPHDSKVLDLSQDASLEENTEVSQKSLDAIRRKVAESHGTLEQLSQQIDIYQGQRDRIDAETQEIIKDREFIKTEVSSLEEKITENRKVVQDLEAEINKNNSFLLSLEDQIRTLQETIEITQQKSQQVIEAEKANADDKLKSIAAEFLEEKERLQHEYEHFTNQLKIEQDQYEQDLRKKRKEETRALDVELYETRKKAEEQASKLLADSNRKCDTIIKATEATAHEVHRESESAAKRLILEATQKANELVRSAHLEAEEVRKKTHSAEIAFLKDKSTSQAELKLMIEEAKDRATNIIEKANTEATAMIGKTETDCENTINAANTNASKILRDSQEEADHLMQQTKAELVRREKAQENMLRIKIKSAEDRIAEEREKLQKDSQFILKSARERAEVIVDSAQGDYNFKLEEIRNLENHTREKSKMAAEKVLSDAETIALDIVEKARNRAATIEDAMSSIIAEAEAEANEIKRKAHLYAEEVKETVPDPSRWEAELRNIKETEQRRLAQLIEPTVRNYLKAIDKAVNNIYLELPARHHKNKIIQEFTQAISMIQERKNQLRIEDMIPKDSETGQRMVPPMPNSKIDEPA